MALRGIKVIAFDCDGVMFNSEAANMAYYNQILSHFGKAPMTHEQFSYSHMHTADEALACLFSKPSELQAAQTYRKRISYLPFLRHMEIEPDLKAVLKRLRSGYKTAVATNRTDTMHRVLIEHNLEDQFDFVVNALDVAHPKPDPEMLIKILDHFKVDCRQTLYVGDSKLDEIAANAAGIPLIAYNNSALSTPYHINRLKSLEDILINN